MYPNITPVIKDVFSLICFVHFLTVQLLLNQIVFLDNFI